MWHKLLLLCALIQLSAKCAILVFEGLLPEPHNRHLLRLLFTTAHWHGLAKLRSHNDLTLDVLDSVTESLGKELRHFRDETSSAFTTWELEQEYQARVRHKTKSGGVKHPGNAMDISIAHSTQGSQAATSLQGTVNQNPAPVNASAPPPAPDRNFVGRRPKAFNLNTYKIHAIRDYAATIRRYGATDSYTTEMVRNFFCPRSCDTHLIHVPSG
jgi:hypothetical protein